MTTVFLDEGIPIVHPAGSPKSLDTVRAVCHDLRHPLAAILPLAGAEGGDVRRRLDGILDQAVWLVDMAVAVPAALSRAVSCALVSAGGFELEPGNAGGMLARIALPALRSRALAS